MVASLPQISEAATRATGDGFRFLSTTKKDTYDNEHIQNISS